MAEVESYVTKAEPTFEDWLEHNRNFFAALNGETPDGPIVYAPFTDVDDYAAEAGIGVEEYFELVKDKVKLPLGVAALNLVHTEMDDAWHIVVNLLDQLPKEEV